METCLQFAQPNSNTTTIVNKTLHEKHIDNSLKVEHKTGLCA